MNTKPHRGYTARIEFDDRDQIFVGRILDIPSVISFHGETETQAQSAFRQAVDNYLNEYETGSAAPVKSA